MTDQRAAPARHEVVADDGHALTVWSRERATPQAAVLLVHGRTWSALPDFDLAGHSTLEALAAQGVAAYALDLRGYGATPRDASGWNTPERAAADVYSVLAWIAARHPELPAPTLVGWSLGALVAQLAAERHPDAASALVLYGHPAARRYGGGPGPGATPLREATTTEAAGSDFLPATDPETVHGFVAAALAADPIRSDWRAWSEFQDLRRPSAQLPTIVLYGDQDATPDRRRMALFRSLPTATKALVVLGNGGHAAHLEAPAARFEQIVGALATDPTRGGQPN